MTPRTSAPVLLASLSLALLPAQAAPQATAQDLRPITTVEGITEYRLDNGLQVLLFPDPSKPQITVNITYFVGSRYEGYGETGMAHLLEHMLFKGTPDHPDIKQELTERGANPNGTTYYDRTNYYEIFPASADNLGWALDLEADRMVHSFIAKKDLDSEMTVVRNEMESGENDPFGVLMERTLSTAYLWHNYGKSTIGARSDVENVPIERLQAFYHKYYQPDNATLVVAGNFDPEAALDLVVKDFGAIQAPVRTGDDTLYPTYTVEPTQDGERSVTLRRVGEVPLAIEAYHVPAGSHPDFAAIDVLSFVLGDSPSGRLYKALVETKLATQASAAALQLREPSPLLLFASGTPDGDIGQVLAVIDSTVDDLSAHPVTDVEVDRAKAALLKDINLSFNSSASIALQFSEWAAMGDWRLFFLHRDQLGEVTADDVNRVAQAYLKRSNRTVGLFRPTESPDRAVIPATPDVASLVEGYRGRATVAAGEEFDPSPANVESRTTRFDLPNGMKVALLPKETRGDQAVIAIRLQFGDEESLMGRGTAGEFAGSMLMRGTREHTRQQIQDELDRLQASGNVGGGPIIATGQIQTVRGSVPDVLRLLGEIVREPAFPEPEFEILREQRLSAIEEARSEPQAVAATALGRHMQDWPAGHPSYTPTPDEEEAAVKAVTVEDARAFYRDFWGPQRGNIVVVGDFDPTEVRRVIEETFGDWTSPHPYRRIAAEFYDPPAENIEIETPDKANAFLYAQQNLALRDTDPDYPALVIAGFMIGGGVLNSRLSERVREQEGLSYAIQAVISGHPIDPSGYFLTAAIYAPQNEQKLQDAVMEELQKVVDDGFTEAELETAKQGWLQSRQLQRAQDGSLASSLSSDLYFDRTLLFDQGIEDAVRGLTLDQVNRAASTWLDPSKLTIVKVGDFAGVSKPGG